MIIVTQSTSSNMATMLLLYKEQFWSVQNLIEFSVVVVVVVVVFLLSEWSCCKSE